jgi:PKD repeat protein
MTKPEVEAFFDARTNTLTYVAWDNGTDNGTPDAVIIDPVLDYERTGSYTFTESVDTADDLGQPLPRK